MQIGGDAYDDAAQEPFPGHRIYRRLSPHGIDVALSVFRPMRREDVSDGTTLRMPIPVLKRDASRHAMTSLLERLMMDPGIA